MGKKCLKLWGCSIFLVALYIMVVNGPVFGQVSPGTVNSKTLDGVGNKITSTVVGADTGLDVNCIAGCGGGAGGVSDINIVQILGVAPSATNAFPQRLSTGVAFYDARDRNWTLASGTDSVSSVQSGVWNIGTLTSITNPVAVTGTFFQATQPVSGTVALSNLFLLDATFTTRINTLGQKTMANSTPVVLSSDQSGIPVTGTFFQVTQPVSGTVTANQGTANATPWNENIAQIAGAVPGVTNPLPTRETDGTGFYSTDVIGANRYRKASIVQDIEVSASNSSVANLNAGITFTGTSQSTLGVGAIQVNLFADQNCTIQVQQAQEDPGVNWNVIDSWTYVANSTGNDAARTIQATGSAVRILVTNNGAGATTALRLQTVVCPICDTLPRGLTQKGNLKVSVEEQAAITTANNDGACLSGAASFTVAASNTSRTWVAVWASPANTDDVYIKLGATATNGDARFAPGQSLNITSGKIYTGVIDAFPNSGTQAVCLMELN